MARHDLKTWPRHFQQVLSGAKRFEFRRDDRSPRFGVEDLLVLREWDPETEAYTGRQIQAVVTHVLRDGDVLPASLDGYCIMSIALLGGDQYGRAPR